MAKQWFVIRSKPNKEKFLAQQLEERQFSIFHPVVRVKPVNPRCRTIIPLFPGYLFVNTDLDQQNIVSLERIPGAVGLVFLGGEPASISDQMVYAIKEKILLLERKSDPSSFKKGEQVSIISGMFSGYDAIFDLSLPGKDRVQVFLNMLRGTQIKVSLPVNYIRSQVNH